MRAVIICTSHRGVFFGRTRQTNESILKTGIVNHLKGARMAIRWGTTRGVMQLAESGPTATSKVGAPADVGLNAVTSVFDVTAEAAALWDAA